MRIFKTLWPKVKSRMSWLRRRFDGEVLRFVVLILIALATSIILAFTLASTPELKPSLDWEEYGRRINLPKECGHFEDNFKPLLLKSIFNEITKDVDSSTRFLVWTCNSKEELCGGIGDRYRSIIISFLMALVSDRTFRIDSEYPAPLTSALIPAYGIEWDKKDYYLSSSSPDGTSSSSHKEKKRSSRSSGDSSSRSDSKKQRVEEEQTLSSDTSEWDRTTGGGPTKLLDLLFSSSKKTRVVKVVSIKHTPQLDRVLFANPKIRSALGLQPASPYPDMSGYFSCLWSVLFNYSRGIQKYTSMLSRKLASLSPHPRQSYIGVQVRLGGKHFTGTSVNESLRTSPSALPHFFSVVDELRSGEAKVLTPELPVVGIPGEEEERENSEEQYRVSFSSFKKKNKMQILKGAPIFLTTDSPIVVEKFKERYGSDSLVVLEDSSTHIDTVYADSLKRVRQGQMRLNNASASLIRTSYSDQYRVRDLFLRVMASHLVLARAKHIVRSSSGFSGTAVWLGRVPTTRVNMLRLNKNIFHGDKHEEDPFDHLYYTYHDYTVEQIALSSVIDQIKLRSITWNNPYYPKLFPEITENSVQRCEGSFFWRYQHRIDPVARFCEEKNRTEVVVVKENAPGEEKDERIQRGSPRRRGTLVAVNKSVPISTQCYAADAQSSLAELKISRQIDLHRNPKPFYLPDLEPCRDFVRQRSH